MKYEINWLAAFILVQYNDLNTYESTNAKASGIDIGSSKETLRKSFTYTSYLFDSFVNKQLKAPRCNWSRIYQYRIQTKNCTLYSSVRVKHFLLLFGCIGF